MLQFLFVFVAFAIVGIRLYTELVTDVIGSRSASQWKKLSEIELNRILQKLQFYRELNASEQKIFLERVMYFCDKKVFLGMDGMLITDEVRAFVSASAVQISFRLDEWKFPSFHTYRVYPESFYSSLFQKFLKGGAGKQGIIWFSYADYESGYADSTNGINLGLHEMAHALVIEMENGNMDSDFTHAYENIERISLDRIERIRNGSYTFLRAYAGTNLMEFIAVCAEYFFEKPNEFRAKDRELYDGVMWLLKQEPHTPPSILQITNLPKEEKAKKNYRYAKWHWSLTLVLIGIFLSPGIFIWQMHKVMIDGPTLFAISSVIVIGSAFLLYKPIVKSGALGLTQFVLCHSFGLGPFVLSVFFLLNGLIPVWSDTNAHKITGLRMLDSKHYIVLLQNEQEINSYDQMIIPQEEASKVQKGSMLITVTKTGLFGMQYPGESYVLNEDIIP